VPGINVFRREFNLTNGTKSPFPSSSFSSIYETLNQSVSDRKVILSEDRRRSLDLAFNAYNNITVMTMTTV